MNSGPGSPAEKIIVALDVARKKSALELVDQLRPDISFFKIGLQLYTAEGPEMVRAIRETGASVFLDLKLHDIPNTVARAVEAAAELDVQMLTIHLSGGEAMIRAAVARRPANLSVLGLTVLTSIDQEILTQTGISDDVARQVVRLGRLGVESGVDGLVASPQEITAVREAFGKKITLVVPGVRPTWSEAGDQRRVMTPREAVHAGADYLVIGRPITAHSSPREAVAQLVAEMAT